MSYTTEWYDNYRQQLQEKIVRSTHDEMFAVFADLMDYPNYPLYVVDLGCATCEYGHHGYHQQYHGIELNQIACPAEYENELITIGNYLIVNLTHACPFRPNAFVSLFSTEIIMSSYEKYNFYEHVFRENPSIQAGLVAGFYYEDKKFLHTVSEKDFDEPVYQTVENQRDFQSDIFSEFRTYRRVPSKMFGDNLIECWKVFMRNLP